jgi:hypothetical protein
MATRDEINEAVRTMLEAATGKKIGLAEMPVPLDPDNPPAGWPALPYAVLWPLDTAPTDGSMEDGNEDKIFYYQATCVGKDSRQVSWMSSKVEAAFMALRPGGGYLHDIPLTGHSVAWRLLQSQGATVPSGEQLFASDDNYLLRIGRD